jgi:N-acetylglucosaminyldiphosphoundecaprenol N-acetyl-beta-D-mannosaminyltransferase
MDDDPVRVSSMLGLSFRASTLAEAALAIIDAAVSRRKTLVVTPNVDHVVTLHHDADMRSIYENAEFVFADGMPIVWLSRLLPGLGLPERVAGSDLLVKICKLAAEHGLRFDSRDIGPEYRRHLQPTVRV